MIVKRSIARDVSYERTLTMECAVEGFQSIDWIRCVWYQRQQMYDNSGDVGGTINGNKGVDMSQRASLSLGKMKLKIKSQGDIRGISSESHMAT